MTPVVTLGIYAGALALVFGAAVAVGNAVGPVGTAGADSAGRSSGDGAAHDAAGAAGEHDAQPPGGVDAAASADLIPGGLAVSQDGYTLQLARTVQTPGTPGRVQFEIAGPDGERVTEFTRAHDKELHLIVVRRDMTGFQHVHPERDAQGRWSVPLTLAQPGPYKVFADFIPEGRDKPLTLAADLTAPGPYTPMTSARPSRTTTVDGYDVSLDGDLTAGASSKLTLNVAKDGRPVTDLQPYLAAYGHLVAIRDGDLAYLHVHPDGDIDDPATEPGPDITFYADVPSASTYRLFLDFQHAGVVRTAAFTATAASAGEAISTAPAPTPPSDSPDAHNNPHDH
jgi:hypothetical protein